MVAADEVWKALASHGVLGILTAILMWAYWKERQAKEALQVEFRESLKAQQKLFLDKQEALMAAQAATVQAMQERMISRSQNEQEKLAGLVTAQQNLIEAIGVRR